MCRGVGGDGDRLGGRRQDAEEDSVPAPVDVVENTVLRRDPRFAWKVCPEAVAI